MAHKIIAAIICVLVIVLIGYSSNFATTWAINRRVSAVHYSSFRNDSWIPFLISPCYGYDSYERNGEDQIVFFTYILFEFKKHEK